MSSQKQLYPVYTTQEHPGGGIQYIPFDDPRIRHISSALGGNSLTDADKIRHIRNELPSVTVSEPASDDSAFLPPPLGPFIAAKLADDANQTSSSNFNNDNNRWHSDLHKETVDNFPATDQNCNRYSKNQRPPPSPSSTFQTPLTRTCSRQGFNSDQVFAETITQVKKIAPDSGPENNRNTKRRVSETIFCLVSVPVHTPTNINKDLGADQNNNETIPSLAVTNTETFAVGLKESPNIRSKSVNEMPIKSHYSHFHTSSTSSMRNYKRAPLRKEIIDAWALQASEDKELCYAGSWPGNQYRNQETQTGSPLTVVKSPEPQTPPVGKDPVLPVSDTTIDCDVGTDNSSSYGYPMAGQKNLNPSSNSAFSRLSFSPTQPQSLEPSQQDPLSPSKARDQGAQQASSPRKSNSSPQESAEHVAFGQFLLKPVNRRPCDAIGELESINKEMEDTISKRPSVGQHTDYLDGVNKGVDRFKSGADFITGPEPGREAISLPPMHIENPPNIKVRSKSFTTDLDSVDMRSVYSRLQANNIPPPNELSVLLNPGPRDNCLLSSLHPHNESNQLYRQDIPVPQESLLRDVGLTVYTETPGGPGEPMQRSLSVPCPLIHNELSQSVQLSWESSTELKSSGSPEHNSNEEVQAEVDKGKKAKSSNVPPVRGEMKLCIQRTRSESSRSPQKKSIPHITSLTRGVSFVFDDDANERYTISEPLTCRNESTIADKHLENLLIQEKANALPAEDLSNLYEVKCAKGIPENESIEQRAARILGIAVPVEALGVADKQYDDNQDEMDTKVSEKRPCQNEEIQQVIGECEQVKEESLIILGTDIKDMKETGLDVEQEEGDIQQQSSSYSYSEDIEETETQAAVVLDLPEFPPNKLPLSLPVTPDEKLALSMCSGEKKGRSGACKLIESLQDKLNSSVSSSAASLGWSTTDRMARLKELDSVSRIRRLSLKGPESGDVYSEEKKTYREESEVQEEAKKEVEDEQEVEDDKILNEERGKVEENLDEHENAHETHSKLEDPEEDCKPEEVNEGICKEEQSQEDEEKDNTEIALTADNEGSKTDVDIKAEEPEGEVELKIVEDDKEKHLEKVRDDQNADEVSRAESTHGTGGEKLPKPKQRTRLPKPPLLPKPRSVPKREITLPLSFSTGTRGPTNMEDEEILSVSGVHEGITVRDKLFMLIMLPE